MKSVPDADAHAPGFEDMLRRRPSVEKLKAAIGFAPATSLDEIIRDTIRALPVAG